MLNKVKLKLKLRFERVLLYLPYAVVIRDKVAKVFEKNKGRANARNVSFQISLRWPIHIINPVDKTKLFANKFGQVVEVYYDLILCLFGFAKATIFRDPSEFSECVQNVLAKSCLPCQCSYVNPQKNLAERENA